MSHSQTLSKHKKRHPLNLLLIIGGVILGIDQLSKLLVVSALSLYEYWEPVPDWGWLFKISYIHNTGTALGMFPNSGWLFIIIGLAVVFAILYYYPLLSHQNWLTRLSLGLQLGGASGNLLDRLRHGYVVDFIDISVLPIFNLADIAIVSGVTLLTVQLWLEGKQQKKAQPA